MWRPPCTSATSSANRASFEPLLALLTASLARQEMESLSVQLDGAPPLVTALHALGFRERREHRLVVGQADGALLSATPEIVDVDRRHRPTPTTAREEEGFKASGFGLRIGGHPPEV